MPDVRQAIVADMISRIEGLLLKWSNPNGSCMLDSFVFLADSASALQPGYPESEVARGKWASLDLLLSVKRYALETSEGDPLRLKECISVAAEIVEQIEKVASQGKLEILQDNASCMTSIVVVFLRKVSQARGFGLHLTIR